MIRLAIFDCDGTLVDSGATIHAALQEALAEHGLPVPPQREASRVIGLSLSEAFAMLVPDADAMTVDRLSASYRLAFQRMRARGAVCEPLFDGIPALLDALASDGWLLAVATGKSDRGLRHCLEAHGLNDRFISLQTADRHPSKPNPSMALQAMADAGASPDATVVIGDTAWDMGLARAAGAGAIGAAWGYHDEVELWSAGAHTIAADPGAVVDLAGQWLRRAA